MVVGAAMNVVMGVVAELCHLHCHAGDGISGHSVVVLVEGLVAIVVVLRDVRSEAFPRQTCVVTLVFGEIGGAGGHCHRRASGDAVDVVIGDEAIAIVMPALVAVPLSCWWRRMVVVLMFVRSRAFCRIETRHSRLMRLVHQLH